MVWLGYVVVEKLVASPVRVLVTTHESWRQVDGFGLWYQCAKSHNWSSVVLGSTKHWFIGTCCVVLVPVVSSELCAMVCASGILLKDIGHGFDFSPQK